MTLLAMAALLWLLACVAGAWLLRRHLRDEARLRRRLAPPHDPAGEVRPGGPTGRNRLMAGLLGLLGAMPEMQDLSPLPLPVVLAGAMLLAVPCVLAIELVVPGGRVLTPLIGVQLCRAWHARCLRRRITRLSAQLPDVLATLVRAVRVGIPVTTAMAMVARDAPVPSRAEFSLVADRLALGASLAEALTDLAQRTHVPEYRTLATALALQAQAGGSLRQTLDRLCALVRQRLALAQRARALSAEMRLSAIVLTAMPGFTAAILMLLNPGYATVLFDTRDGRHMLALALFMLLCGWMVIRVVLARNLP